MTDYDRPLISAIRVRNLHGHRSYDIDVPTTVESSAESRLLLLHGDNGSGKTTLLRLVWHTLSSADDKGHRTHLARTPFSILTIEFSNSKSLTVAKTNGLVGDFTITLVDRSATQWIAEFPVDDELRVSKRHRSMWQEYSLGSEIYSTSDQLELLEIDNPALREARRSRRFLRSSEDNEQKYFDFLDTDVHTPLFLADDRSLYSDDPAHHRTREILSRRVDVYDNPQHIPTSRQVSLELSITIRRVNDILRSLTIGGQTDGSANSNTIYADVLRRLVNSPSPLTQHISDGDLNSFEPSDPPLKLLHDISTAAPSFERYGLAPPLDVSTFDQLLRQAKDYGLEGVASSIIEPFLSSIKAQQLALRPAQQLLESLIPTVNDFLQGKTLSFTPRNGLRIHTSYDDNPLEPKDLSSGERQLLMVLFTTLLARFDTRLFIIDEPELSMGVAWQRKLVDAFLNLTEGSTVQFLVATHSIEIISSHINSLVQLKEI